MRPKPASLHAVVQCTLSTLLLFLAGSFFSLSVFTVPIARSQAHASGLDAAWTAGMALMSLVAIPFTTTTGAMLTAAPTTPPPNSGWPASKTACVRAAGIFSSICIAALLLAVPFIQARAAVGLAAVVAVQGIPFNMYFFLSLELLAAWSPRYPGLAVGCGQTVFGLGSVATAAVYEGLIRRLGLFAALNISTVALATVTASLSYLLNWPPDAQDGHERVPENDGCTPLSPRDSKTLSFKQVLGAREFWLYVIALLSTQLGFAFVPHYFNMGQAFGKPMHTIVTSYEAMFLVATLVRPLLGVLCDLLKFGSGHFSIASKNVTILILVMQALLFLILIPVSNSVNYSGFAAVSALIFVAFGAGECLAPILARDIFGAANSSVVFGAGGSIAFGVGEFAAAEVVSLFSSDHGSNRTPSLYNSSYIVCFWSTIVGAGAAALISKHCMEKTESCLEGQRNKRRTKDCEGLVLESNYGSLTIEKDLQDYQGARLCRQDCAVVLDRPDSTNYRS